MAQSTILFECPNCDDGDSLEEVVINAIVTNDIDEIQPDGEVDYLFPPIISEGTVSHYQCAECGWTVPDISDKEALAKWLLAQPYNADYVEPELLKCPKCGSDDISSEEDDEGNYYYCCESCKREWPAIDSNDNVYQLNGKNDDDEDYTFTTDKEFPECPWPNCKAPLRKFKERNEVYYKCTACGREYEEAPK